MASDLAPKSLFSLQGKHGLVTGGASGLGRMIAQALLEAGASVTLTSRKANLTQEAAKQLSELGNRYWIAADLAEADAVEALAQLVQSGFGEDTWNA